MPKNPNLKTNARRLRQEMTPAEKILWPVLRGRRFVGFKFRRQQIVGSYIADFFCAQLRLIVELDGESHLGKEERDAERISWFEAEGYKVLRFWNTDIYEDLECVLEAIWRECQARLACGRDPSPPTPSPSALPQGERGASPPTPRVEGGTSDIQPRPLTPNPSPPRGEGR